MEPPLSSHPSSDAEASASSPAAPCPKCDEYLAGWKRSQADYRNLQKDVADDRTKTVAFANQRLLLELLPVIDQFDLAMRHCPDPASLPEAVRAPWKNWLVGLQAVYGSWNQLAHSLGLERVPVEGAFDPAMHEAAGEEPVEGKAAGEIARAVHDGWRLHGRLLRPARVILVK